MMHWLLGVAGSTERFTALCGLLLAVLALLGAIGKAALHVLRTGDALLTELHANTTATKDVGDRLAKIEQRVDAGSGS